MKTRVLMATVGGAAAALAAGVMWTAPSASAGSDFCNSLPTPAQVHDCNCGYDNVPGTQEYQQCLHGNAAAPGPASSPPPVASAAGEILRGPQGVPGGSPDVT